MRVKIYLLRTAKNFRISLPSQANSAIVNLFSRHHKKVPSPSLSRIMWVSPNWVAFFRPFPPGVRRALTESLLAAWMEKTLQYPVTEYLPLPVIQQDYTPGSAYSDFSGGRVWEAAQQFRAAGVSDDLLKRLQNWGIAYTDRAARLQYH